MASAQVEPLVLKEWVDPVYSPLARSAHIEGEVEVSFRIDASGRTRGVDVKSGHPILVRAAEDAVKSWVFALPEKGTASDQVRATTIRYVLSEREEGLSYDDSPEVSVVYASESYIQVTAYWSRLRVEGCGEQHDPASTTPDSSSEGPVDYIQLNRNGSYRVTLYRLGLVEWDGSWGVASVGSARAVVDPVKAARMFDDLRDSPFWQGCNLYSPYLQPLHGSSVTLAAFVGGQRKVIDDSEGAGPDWLRDLTRRLDAVAETHQWTHGDPAEEQLRNISYEHFGVKPGMTAWMQAAASGHTAPLVSEEPLESHIADADSSRWTALMYAAGNDQEAWVSRLIEAGADVNHRDGLGRSPLMAAATNGSFNLDLVAAGAEVNAQSKAGLTALMILASEGDDEEIATALQSGADPTLTDAEGRRAVDYLVASDCGHNILRDILEYPIGQKYGCGALDEEQFQNALQLLMGAVRRQR